MRVMIFKSNFYLHLENRGVIHKLRGHEEVYKTILYFSISYF